VVLIPGIPLFPIMWLPQVLNAILLPVVLVLVLRLINNPRVMGTRTNSRLQNVLALALTVMISLITLILFISPLLPKI
jgi:Mn2+/Fe2+ NRAMP family transporter